MIPLHILIKPSLKTVLTILALIFTLLALSNCATVREPSDEEMYRFVSDRQYYLDQQMNKKYEANAELETKRLEVLARREALKAALQQRMINNYQAQSQLMGQAADAAYKAGAFFTDLSKPTENPNQFSPKVIIQQQPQYEIERNKAVNILGTPWSN